MPRQGLLVNSGEDTIHKNKVTEENMTPKQKRKNFWFYHKTHFIVGFIALVLVAWFVYDWINRDNPDYTIDMITVDSYPVDLLHQLEDAIAQQGDDLNGDGKAVVLINQYTMNPGGTGTSNANLEMANYTRIAADLESKEVVLFFLDDTNLAYYQSVEDQEPLFAYEDGTTPVSGATDYENMGYYWDEMEALNSVNYTVNMLNESGDDLETVDAEPYLEKLRLCVRTFGEADMENPDIQQRLEQSKALQQRLVSAQAEQAEQGQ